MLAVLALALLAQCSPQGPIYSCPATQRAGHAPFIPDAGVASRVLFAMSDGSGMGLECAGANVTTPDGGALVVVRSSVAECISSDGQTITQVAADKPRVMSGAVNRTILGVMSEQTARENLTKNNRDLSQAAWVTSNMTCTRTAAGMRGGDSNGASHCCATAANGTVKQTILTANGGEQVHSWHLKRSVGTGAVNLSIDGSTWLADISSQLSSSLWKRAVPTETVGCTAVNGGTSNCIVQAGLYGAPNPPVQSLRIVTSGDCVDVDFTQVERAVNGVASTPIENPSTTYVTRTAETVDLTIAGTYPAQYCVAATSVISRAGAGSTPTVFPRFAGVIGDKSPGTLAGSDSFAQAYMNTSASNVLVTSTTVLASPNSLTSSLVPDGGTMLRLSHYWNMANLTLCVDGFCADGQDNPEEGAPDSDPYTAPAWTRIRLGGYETTNGAIDGVMSEVTADPDAVVCPRHPTVQPSGFAAAIGDSITAHPAGVPGWMDEANRIWRSGSRLQGTAVAKGGAYTGTNGGTGNNALSYQWTTFVKNRRYQVLFVLGGVNDILSGKNMTTALANLTTIWDEARDAGMDVHPMTLTPAGDRAGWNSTKQTQLETLNTAIRSYCSAHGLTCVELYTPDFDHGGLRVPDGGIAMDPRCGSSDGLHPGVVCETRIAERVTAAHP